MVTLEGEVPWPGLTSPHPLDKRSEALKSVEFRVILQGRGTADLAKRGGVWDTHVTGNSGTAGLGAGRAMLVFPTTGLVRMVGICGAWRQAKKAWGSCSF